MSDEQTERKSIAAIFQYHNYLAEKYGSGTTGALGWMQSAGQQARFEKLSRIGDMNGCTVMDAGCGYAGLFPFLRAVYPSVIYHGCEQMPAFLNLAAHRYKGEKNITLWLKDFMQEGLPATDYVLASGSLNYRHENTDFIYKAIEALYAKCRLGLGFNLLSYTEDRTLLASYDAKDIVRFCKDISGKVELHEGYWKHDFTLFVYKQVDVF